MDYLDAVGIFKKIEEKNDVMGIKYKGVSLWPYLRIYLLDAITSKGAVKHSSSALILVLKTLFRYNPLKFFGYYRVWTYAASITRKKIGEKYEHHVSGYLHKSGYSVLTIEFPSPGAGDIKRKEMPEKNLVSSSWSLLLMAVIEQVMRPFPIEIEGEKTLKEIIAYLGADFNYKTSIRHLLAQKKTKDIVLALGHKPELVILECYYTNMGNIWSFHNHNIPVIELQHGVANKNHNAYNSCFYSEEFYPDEICVYGVEEYDYFSKKTPPFSKKVSQTGLYMLDRANNYFANDPFVEYRKKYRKIIVVAGETIIEDKMSRFIDDAAKRCPNWLFIYIPRRISDFNFVSSNVKKKFGVNIYEYLKWCDVLVTHASTTGLETHYFRKPVVYYDFDGIAMEYYGKIIKEQNGAFYIHTLDEFIEVIENIELHSYSFREIFAHESDKKMSEVLSRYLGTPK